MIEITQFFSRLIGNYRQVDIDDVILNTIGAIAGYFIYRNLFETGSRPEPEANLTPLNLKQPFHG
jgi:glycopeptide antibiotics resistance protein